MDHLNRRHQVDVTLDLGVGGVTPFKMSSICHPRFRCRLESDAN